MVTGAVDRGIRRLLDEEAVRKVGAKERERR